MSDRMAWREGAYAGFWQRVAGYIIDSLILSAGAMVVIVVLFAAIGGFADPADPEEVEVLAGVVMVVVSLGMLVAFFLYDTLMTSRSGATLGKRAAGIEVRTLDGDLPSFGLATGRFFARYLSSFAFGLGYLWMLWDPQAQTWQDKLCNTVVVKRDALMPVGAGWTQHWQTPVAAGQPPAWGAPAAGAGWGTPAAASWGTPQPAAGGDAPQPEEREPVGDAAGPETSGAGDGGRGWGALQGETMETASWGRTEQSAPPAEPQTGPQPDAGSDAEGSPAIGGTGEASGSTAVDGPPADAPEAAPGEPARANVPDPNVVAISRAGLAPESASWLQQVAGQVDTRLDRVNPAWRSSPQADAARACAFGILIGHLSRVHPHMTDDLRKVAEVHPSFSTLLEGSRLATLVEIAAEPGRATAWLGPLIDVNDPEHIGRLLA